MVNFAFIARLFRAFLFLVAAFSPLAGFGQGQSGRVVLDGGFSLEVPKGWTTTPAVRDVLLTLHAPGQADVQIEVRRVKLPSVDRVAMFSDSFQTSLRYAGFSFLSRGAQMYIPEVAGATTEYRALASQGMYRLVVVELVNDDTVWLVCGFFDERRRDGYMRTFNRIVAGIALGAVAE